MIWPSSKLWKHILRIQNGPCQTRDCSTAPALGTYPSPSSLSHMASCEPTALIGVAIAAAATSVLIITVTGWIQGTRQWDSWERVSGAACGSCDHEWFAAGLFFHVSRKLGNNQWGFSAWVLDNNCSFPFCEATASSAPFSDTRLYPNSKQVNQCRGWWNSGWQIIF